MDELKIHHTYRYLQIAAQHCNRLPAEIGWVYMLLRRALYALARLLSNIRLVIVKIVVVACGRWSEIARESFSILPLPLIHANLAELNKKKTTRNICRCPCVCVCVQQTDQQLLIVA